MSVRCVVVVAATASSLRRANAAMQQLRAHRCGSRAQRTATEFVTVACCALLQPTHVPKPIMGVACILSDIRKRTPTVAARNSEFELRLPLAVHEADALRLCAELSSANLERAETAVSAVRSLRGGLWRALRSIPGPLDRITPERRAINVGAPASPDGPGHLGGGGSAGPGVSTVAAAPGAAAAAAAGPLMTRQTDDSEAVGEVGRPIKRRRILSTANIPEEDVVDVDPVTVRTPADRVDHFTAAQRIIAMRTASCSAILDPYHAALRFHDPVALMGDLKCVGSRCSSSFMASRRRRWGMPALLWQNTDYRTLRAVCARAAHSSPTFRGRSRMPRQHRARGR